MEEIGRIAIPDYFVIVGYFAVIIFVGYYFMKYISKIKEYFAAGSAIPWWMAGISYWMCSFSALLFVMYSELAYKYGYIAISINVVSIPALLSPSYVLEV